MGLDLDKQEKMEMKTGNWIFVLMILVSGLAQAKTWAKRKDEAKKNLALTDKVVVDALASFTNEIEFLKKDREEHKDQTADNAVKAEHGIDLATQLAEGIQKLKLN